MGVRVLSTRGKGITYDWQHWFILIVLRATENDHTFTVTLFSNQEGVTSSKEF